MPHEWRTVSGSDFGRSIRWARTQTNQVNRQIREKLTTMTAQLAIAFDRAEIGATRAADRAERQTPGWKDRAWAAFDAYCTGHSDGFTVEDVRTWAENLSLVESPPDARAWGQVALRAMREGIVVKAGYRPVASSNGSAKVLWRSVR